MKLNQSYYKSKLYRIQNLKWFYKEPSDFYKNFLENTRTFLKQDRFAGSMENCGFYFGNRAETVFSEMFYYLGLNHEKNETIQSCLKKINNQTNENFVLLEVEVDVKSYISLLDSVNIHTIFEKYILSRIPSKTMTIDLYSMLSSLEPGGTMNTDLIGHLIKHFRHKALSFPSSRTINNTNITKNYFFNDDLSDLILRTVTNVDGEILFEYHAFDTYRYFSPSAMMDDGQDSFKEFLNDYYNFVFLCGSTTTRSIKSYSIIDENNDHTNFVNPYFGISESSLEKVRLEEAKFKKVNDTQAIKLGLLSDLDIEIEFMKLAHYKIPK